MPCSHSAKRIHLIQFFFLFILQIYWAPALTMATASNAAQSCLSSGWPHEQSDLPHDQSLIFGALDNGLRYVLKQNKEPKNRVAMYLNVQAGSLQETEEQRGVAHYLEHMLFNGTTHYPPGTLVEYFQGIGMDFGADTNAHTSYDETVYQLILPDGREKTLAEGYQVLVDYAQGALLLEKEVERERGIIFSEKRTRDSAEARAQKSQMQFDFAGSLIAKRDPIGLDAVLQHADAKLLRSYYERWYRPDNMFVVVVGDFEKGMAEEQLRKYFATLAPAKNSKPDCPVYGKIQTSGTKLQYLPEPELGYTSLSISSVRALSPVADTLHNEDILLKRYLALVLFNNRLQKLERQPNSPLSKSMAYSGTMARQFDYSLLSTRTEAKNWQQGMQLLYTTLAQVKRDGFTQAELERGKKEIQAILEKDVQTANARDSRSIAEQLIRNINDNEVTMSPQQAKDLFLPLLSQYNLGNIHLALQAMWPDEPRSITVAGTALVDMQQAVAKQTVEKFWQDVQKEPVAAWKEGENKPFPYLKAPTNEAVILSHEHHEAIQAESYTLGGGVRLNVKQTGFQPNQVLLSAYFGHGLQSQPQPGAGLLAQGTVKESGTATLTNEQLQQSLAGTNISLQFVITPESFSWEGSSLSSEADLLVQLLYTRLHDADLSQPAFQRSKELFRQMYSQMDNAVEGVSQLQGERYLSGGRLTYTMPTWQEMNEISHKELANWILPAFSDSPLEINIVGDITPETALKLVTRYFGAEQRQEQRLPTQQVTPFPLGKTLQLSAPGPKDKAVLTVAWETAGFWSITRTRRLNLLAKILDDRLRVHIREERGATYAPQVFSVPSKIDKDFGLFESRMIVLPEQAEELASLVKKVAQQIGMEGISEQEFKRAQEPTLTAIREQLRTNDYWLQTVLSLSSRHPEQLIWPESILEDFTHMRPEEIQDMAKDYLQESQAATVIVHPR